MEPQNFQPEPEPEPEPTLTCPYPREHTEFLEYLGRYSPEPIWNRLSPFDRQGLLHKYEHRMDTYLRQGKRAEGFVPRNPFLWGMRIVGMKPKAFFWHLPKNIKAMLRRGCYKVSVITKTTESTKPFSLEDAKVTLKEGSGSITFDWYRALAGRDHSEFKFEWGQPLYVDIWILIRRIPFTFDDSKFYKEIMVFIEEPLTKYLYELPNLKKAIVDAEQEYSVIAHNYSLTRPDVVTPEMVKKGFLRYFHLHFIYPFVENVHKHWDSNYREVQRFMSEVVKGGEPFTCTSEVIYDGVSFTCTSEFLYDGEPFTCPSEDLYDGEPFTCLYDGVSFTCTSEFLYDGEPFTYPSEVPYDGISFKYTLSFPYYPYRCYKHDIRYFAKCYDMMHYRYRYNANDSCGEMEMERFMRTVLSVEDGESFTCTSEVLDDRVSFKFTHSHPYYPYRCYEDHSQKFLEWYAQVLRGKIILQHDTKGFDMRPWIMSIWTNLQEFFNSKFKEMKVENLSDNFVEYFASEFDLWAISGESDPNVHLANETEIYSVFSKSVRNMPSKLNQWCLVDGKEPDPIPLVRHIKFPCQKAYSAFATKREAEREIDKILDLYGQFFEEFLAVPIIKGKTSELEKLADGLYTATVEVFLLNSRYYESEFDRKFGSKIKNAWGIRGATAHCLGEKAMGWVNSWSCSFRAIGLMVMVHGDDKGLVLPPEVAPVQVIVIPGPGLKKSDIPGIHDTCNCIVDALCEAGIRAKADLDINESIVIRKYPKLANEFITINTYWERKGVPLRIQVGSENDEDQLLAIRRDNGKKFQLSRDSVSEEVKGYLKKIQKNLLEAAKSRQEACIRTVTSLVEFVKAFTFDSSKIVLAPWCDEEEVEKNVKSRIDFECFGLEVKTLCSPLEQPDIPEGTRCIFSGKPARKWTYWGLRF
ncbi:hypothetical protein Q3G72_014657 [Acer saccharum]|nr:hypothetical protein Q3G72_014657 [Acer saccharum]